MKGMVFVESKDALKAAMECTGQQGVMWTDGPRLESGAVGAAVAYRDGERWVKRGTYLGKNKEVFDAEVYAILRAAKLLDERGERDRAYLVFSDSQAAIARVQHDGTGLAQALAKATIRIVDSLTCRANTLTVR